MDCKPTALLFAALILCFSGCGGCYTSTPPGGPEDGSDDSREREDFPTFELDWLVDDLRPDEYLLPDPDHPDPDIMDEFHEDVEPDLSPPCPPQCLPIPEDGRIGAPCSSDADCDYGATCYTEDIEFFNSEMYVSNPLGQCLIIGAGSEGCDPDVPITCPAGSRCMYAGNPMGMDYYGCFDECEPMDPFFEPYEFNCGCREGYRCDPDAGICVSGCSHDRECCETWTDLNGDFMRSTDEVMVNEDCTNVCDNGGLYDEPPAEPGLCAVTFDCINYGDPAAACGDPCIGDAWCPAGGRCLDEFHHGIPCGYCTIDWCNYVAFGCEECDGACANLGSSTDPFYICIKPCHFGKTLDDPEYECRTGPPGCEHACWPVENTFWDWPPDDGSDGFCWIGNFPGGDRPIGASCEEDEDCVSPFGLGECMAWTSIEMAPFCGVQCIERVAREYALCGGDDGMGTAEGACWSGICREACDNPDGDLGANGCTQAEAMACYDVMLFGSYISVGDGLDVPAGICFPACTDNAWCADFYGSPMTCNEDTGVCG